MSNENTDRPQPSDADDIEADEFDDVGEFSDLDEMASMANMSGVDTMPGMPGMSSMGGMGGMASMMGMMGMMGGMEEFGSSSSRILEGPDGTRLIFLEQRNIVDEDVEDLDARMKFIGRWLINGESLCTPDGKPAIGGLGADFLTEEEPTLAWIWFEEPLSEELQRKFGDFFDSEFDEDGKRMNISVGAFMDFADSESWDADMDDEHDTLLF